MTMIAYAEGRQKLFAWLPSVTQGVAHVRYKIGHEKYRASGTGYHDHNWGDVPMQTIMHNWYWARAKAGPYTVIACYITATEAYDYETQNLYILAKDDATGHRRIATVEAARMLADNPSILADDDAIRASMDRAAGSDGGRPI